MADFIYTLGKTHLLQGNVDMGNAKVALFTSSYSPAQSSDTLYSALSGELASGNGYTTGGAALASQTYTDESNTIEFDAADVSWTFTASKTFRYAVLYDSSSSRLLAKWDVNGGSDLTVNGTFTIQWDGTNGILRLG